MQLRKAKMISKDVKKDRYEYIGGSDIAKVLGVSRYGTAYELWCEKTGRIAPKDLSSVEAVELGTDLEEFVAKKFSQKTGLKVRQAGKAYQHPDYPYMVAHVDRIVVGEDAILECKTCGAQKKKEWENNIPIEYIYQVIWYLGITGRQQGWVACLIGGQSFDYKPIFFDKALFDLMVKRAKEFWYMVEHDIPPAIIAQDGKILDEVYPTSTDELIENNDLNDLIAYRQELQMHIDEMTKEKEEIETQLKTAIAEKLGIVTDKYQVTWKTQHSARLNTTMLKQDYPEIFENYIQETKYRVLRITKRKEG